MDIEIPMGEIKVTNGKDNLIASGIGSCLVITLYDPKQRIGALAHTMLPTRNPSFVAREASNESRTTNHEQRTTNNERRDTRYIDTAIEVMLDKLITLGAKRENLEAKLIGGANMFAAFGANNTGSIGMKNIDSAKESLKKQGIPIVGECLGGSQGRSVEFAVASGIVTVKTKF